MTGFCTGWLPRAEESCDPAVLPWKAKKAPTELQHPPLRDLVGVASRIDPLVSIRIIQGNATVPDPRQAYIDVYKQAQRQY